MQKSLSQPSVLTTGTVPSMGETVSSRFSHYYEGRKMVIHHVSTPGSFLWRGRVGKITRAIVLLPWSIWWQVLVLISITYAYFVLFLHYIVEDMKWLRLTCFLTDGLFMCDVIIHLLHVYWPVLRLHVRVYRRNCFLLFYDVISLLPYGLTASHINGYPSNEVAIFGRFLVMFRIYRLLSFVRNINEAMHSSRKLMYTIEYIGSMALVLHAATCLWFKFHNNIEVEVPWHNIGYPVHVGAENLKMNSYMTCWYYCACRIFSVLFGDSFPGTELETWLSSFLMLCGYIVFTYRYIGLYAWEYVKFCTRRMIFVDQYLHMLTYLKFRCAPPWLMEQAEQYKQTLWKMKDGVINSNHLQKLPLSLQMELIFDINVGYFHNSLLFRDTGEPFMRQISLHMRHEIFLAGQYIWSQGVVKSGMICVKHGVIEILSDEDDESPMIAFTEGTVLGEVCLFYSMPAKVTVKAATYVELQVLKRTDFMRAMSEQPHMLEVIRRKIDDRIVGCIRKQTDIIKYDSADLRLIRTRYRPMKVLKDHLAGIQSEDATFVDDSHMFYRDENNDRQSKFTQEYLELYKLSENVSNINSPHICWRANFPWILEPNTDFTRMCEVIHFFAVLYICIFLPYSVILAKKITDIQQIIMATTVAVGLILNLYIQLTTAIVHKNTRKVTVKQIAEEKMATFGFYIDIISVFPMSIFSETMDKQGETAIGQITNVIPILQVWHIWDYMCKWQRNFKANLKLMCLLKFTLFIVIFSYWTGCFLYLFACPRKLCKENSWMTELVYRETKVYLTKDAKHEKISMTSFLYGTSIITGAGNGEIVPGLNDLLFVIFLITIGSFLKSIYIAKVCSLYNLSTKRKLKFKESMRELFYFLSANHVSVKIKKRVKKFFCVQWYYNKAISVDELFKDTSTSIRQEVLSLEMVETLMICPLFQECSRDFLQTVTANTRTIVLPDNEIVQRTADIGRDMYILQKGHCDIIDNHGKVVANISHGSHFGVIEMFYGLPKVYTVVTTTNCIFLHMEYSSLIQCLSTFPDISYPINMVLEDEELKEETAKFEVIKIINSKIDAKTNRIAQELKESFVFLTGRNGGREYTKPFEKLGVMRYIKFIIVPISITPHGIFLKCWCVLRFIVAVYYVITCPYNIATSSYRFGGGGDFFDILLYLDMIVMAYIAYYNEKEVLVTHPLYTISNYLKNGFVLDFITVFPFELLFKVINDKTDVDLYRMNRLLQVSRITSAFSYLETNIMRVYHFVVLLKFLPLATVCVNIATAFLFYNTCQPFLPENSYFVMSNCTRSTIISNIDALPNLAISEYVHTFYWVLSVFIGCGCLPIFPNTETDMMLIMLLQLTGVLYFGFMFGYVASSRSTTTNALLEHMEKTRDLSNFLFQQNVDPILTLKTVKYFEYIWKRTNGSNPQQICRRLHSVLMEDTLVFMYEKTLREVPLFGKVERSFIRVITQHLHEMYFLKGETVVQCRDVQPYIFIIYRGKVDVLSPCNEMVTCMGPGGMFGNFTGKLISCSAVTIFASRSLDLLVISSQVFFNLVKYYPKIKEPLNKAFERSKDYILPITMDIADDDETSDESFIEEYSVDSGNDSRSGSSRIDLDGMQATRCSHSSISRSDAKSSASSQGTAQNIAMHNLFRPGSNIYQCFGYVASSMATFSYVLTLYEIVTLNNCHFIVWVQSLLDIFFFFKVYIGLHKGYSNKYGNVTMDPAKCRRRYFKDKYRVWSDVIFNLPFECLAFCFSKPMNYLHYCRVFKLGRLKYLREFYKETAAELTNNIITLQTMMTVFVVVILVHTFTCIWLITVTALSPLRIMHSIKLYRVDDSITPANERWDYVTSFYMVSSTLTAAGADEILIEGHVLMVIVCVYLISGKLLAAVVVATSMQIAYSTKHALTNYETATLELIDVLKNQGLSRYQLNKFWKYVTQLWVSERGRQIPALLAETPYVRRCDLMSAMFGQYLRNCFLFCDTGDAFLRQLSAVMSYTIFFPGNYIVVAGDSEARMHWVVTGMVAVVSVRADLTETTHETLHSGDVFGVMQGINKGTSHCFSYRAEAKVSIVTLSLENWIDILQFFPEARASIVEKAEKLYAQI